MNEYQKNKIIQDLESKIGSNVNELRAVYAIEDNLINRRDYLQSSLSLASNQVPSKLSVAIVNAEKNSKQVEKLKDKSEKLQIRIKQFLDKTGPWRNELSVRLAAICKYEGILLYLKAFEKVDDLSAQLKQCVDDEQAVLLYSELKGMCAKHSKGHQASYIREYTHYWHNVLKDKLTKEYEDLLKLLKWPFTTAQQHSPPPKEVLTKFASLTWYLLLIEEPKECLSSVSGDFSQEQDPCLPVRILLRPLKKRFSFHFTGSRQTARIDRPEWFLTQTLTWIKDHQGFIKKYMEPVVYKHVKRKKAENEFNEGLVSFAAERLHTVLGLYQTQSQKGEIIDVDAAFAHAVDETLGFHKELVQFTGKDSSTVLSVLTKAETFIKWLAVEKKYALAKMDETLGSEQWMEAVCSGTVADSGAASWVPRGSDWLVTLLKTIEDRYAVLPQPGHRLQFLELQLELIEEWRVRLTQLLSAAATDLSEESFLTADDSPHPLTAVINSAYHTRMVLLQWAHTLHYLQLYYYRRQFQHFTQQQHHDGPEPANSDDTEEGSAEKELDETLSLKDVEVRARKLALNEASRKSSVITIYGDTPEQETIHLIANKPMPTPNLPVLDSDEQESGVFGEAPALLAHLHEAGLTALAVHILLEFKAALRDYKKQKWHAMTHVEEMSLSVSPALCRPLGGLCARLHAANAKLAPPFSVKLRSHVTAEVDQYLFEEVVLESWWNTGGTVQFTYDVMRNLVPAFAPPTKLATDLTLLPKLLEACKLLNLDYDDARRLRASLAKGPGGDSIHLKSIRYIYPEEALQILSQRTDLADDSPPSVLEMF